MKKFLLIAVAAFGMLMTACSKDEVAQPVAEKSVVTFTISTPELATRAHGDGLTATVLKYAVYNRVDGSKLFEGQPETLTNKTATVDIPFVNGMEYDILFWAEAPTSPYTVNFDAKTVAYANADDLDSNSEAYDAFYAYVNDIPEITGPVTKTVELKRPFAQLNIITNDATEAAQSGVTVKDVKVVVEGAYTDFDLANHKGLTKGTVTFDTAAAQTTTNVLAVNYLFPAAEKSLVDVEFTYTDVAGKLGTNGLTKEFATVPIQRNYRTNIVGSLLTSEGTFDVKILPGFDGEPGHKYEVVSVATAQELQNAVDNGASEIILEDDIVLNAPIVFGTSTRAATANAYVLDLNGKELKGAVDKSLKGFVKNNGTLIVKNGTITSTATNGAAAILNTGILTVENATLNGAPSDTTTGTASYALNTNGAGSEVVLNNVNISGRGAVGATEGTKVEINSGNYHTPAIASGHAIYANGAGTEVTINGGKFTEGYEYKDDLWGMYQIYSGNNAKVIVKGGDFSQTWDCANGYDLCTASGGTIEIFGGVFADNPASQNGNNYLATEDYEAVLENGVWNVVAKSDAVVTVNGVGYPSIKAAAKAAKKGEAVVLINDMTLSEIMVLDLPIVFDGNGKTLTSTAGRAINVSGADGVTIKNLTINCSGERAINVIQNATNVTIENVTATAANYTVNVASSAPEAVVAIKNSTLNGLCTVNVSAAGANVTLDGCTVNCNDNNTTVGEVYAAVSLNKEAVNGVIAVTNSTINVAEGSDSKTARNGAPNGTVTINGSTEGVSVMVAAVTYEGSSYYYAFATLEEAIKFAKEGDVITLIRDITIEGTLTLNLEGKTLVTNGMLTNAGELTIKGGKLISENNADKPNTIISTAGKLTLDGVELDHNCTTAGAAIRVLGGEAVINNAVVNAENLTLFADGAEVKITGAESSYFSNASTDDGTWAYAVKAQNGAVLTINGGSFEGKHGVITSAKNGSIIINDGVFFIQEPANGSGYPLCAGGENAVITVNGGKFSNIRAAGASGYAYNGGKFNLYGGLFKYKTFWGGVDESVIWVESGDADYPWTVQGTTMK